jgi:hypothetical protein
MISETRLSASRDWRLIWTRRDCCCHSALMRILITLTDLHSRRLHCGSQDRRGWPQGGWSTRGHRRLFRAFTEDALDDYKQRIMTPFGMDPQVGSACCAYLSHRTLPSCRMLQVTPPLLPHDLFERFDDDMVDYAMNTIREFIQSKIIIGEGNIGKNVLSHEYMVMFSDVHSS